MIKNTLLILGTFVLLFQSCTNRKEPKSQTSTNSEEIALNFDTEEIYKELIRRSFKISDSLSHISLDSTLSFEEFDTLRNEVDTVIKPSESDTVMLTSIKEQFKKYSDQTLFAAYNQILEKRAENKGIPGLYGDDNRKEVNNSLSSNYVSSSKCVFALIEKKYLSKNGSFMSLLSKGSYSQVYKLCNDEKYGDQKIYADCSAFAISSNTVATAGHCINRSNYTKYLLVSDFTIDKLDSYVNIGIPENNIFEITKLVERGIDNKDFAILLVNKTITQDRIARLSKKSTYTIDDYFYVIGFPCGLPMKICNSATFRQNSNPYYFQINSDTYGGNSGSPVFNEQTNEVEGILVRGNTDFFFNINDCRSSIKCPEFGCRGEDVTKVKLISKYGQVSKKLSL